MEFQLNLKSFFPEKALSLLLLLNLLVKNYSPFLTTRRLVNLTEQNYILHIQNRLKGSKKL